jgi:hypothetical protein
MEKINSSISGNSKKFDDQLFVDMERKMSKLQRKYKKLSVFNESNIQHRNTTDRNPILVQEEQPIGSTKRGHNQKFQMEAYSEDYNQNQKSNTDVRNKTMNLNHINQ